MKLQGVQQKAVAQRQEEKGRYFSCCLLQERQDLWYDFHKFRGAWVNVLDCPLKPHRGHISEDCAGIKAFTLIIMRNLTLIITNVEPKLHKYKVSFQLLI